MNCIAGKVAQARTDETFTLYNRRRIAFAISSPARQLNYSALFLPIDEPDFRHFSPSFPSQR
jgi:hypothetical protein